MCVIQWTNNKLVLLLWFVRLMEFVQLYSNECWMLKIESVSLNTLNWKAKRYKWCLNCILCENNYRNFANLNEIFFILQICLYLNVRSIIAKCSSSIEIEYLHEKHVILIIIIIHLNVWFVDCGYCAMIVFIKRQRQKCESNLFFVFVRKKKWKMLFAVVANTFNFSSLFFWSFVLHLHLFQMYLHRLGSPHIHRAVHRHHHVAQLIWIHRFFENRQIESEGRIYSNICLILKRCAYPSSSIVEWF